MIPGNEQQDRMEPGYSSIPKSAEVSDVIGVLHGKMDINNRDSLGVIIRYKTDLVLQLVLGPNISV
jgi:hypothetical protein